RCLAGGQQRKQRQRQYRQGFHSVEASVLLLGEGAGKVAFAFQHFTSVSPYITSVGATRWQGVSACGHRGWIGQRARRLIGLGKSPVRRGSGTSSSGAMLRTESSRARV